MMPSESKFPPVPKSIVTASRSEITHLKLNIRESKLADGGLPHDLRGHVFIVAPVGSVDSDGLPYADGDAIFNGDGMIYRLDFNSPEEVLLQSRLAKTPCYYADEATQSKDEYQEFRFRNRGLTRFSPTLGSRNQLNTAFLSLSYAEDEQERLLLTYDAGRPYEIDTETLEVVTPVGQNSEWHSEVSLNFPFPPVLGTAHPTFDPNSQEMYTINYGRSLNNLLEAIPFIHDLEQLPQEIDAVLAKIRQLFPKILQKIVLNFFSKASDSLYHVFRLSARFMKMEDFVYLIRWDGQGLLQRWKVVLSDGTPVRIEQTMHQIGMTQDYLVLIDTNFKAGMTQVYNNPFPHHAELERLWREISVNPVLPYSTVYIVRRQDLKNGQYPAHNDKEVTVIAKKLVLPLPLIHFTLDYENPDHQMTLYAVHNCGDLAEWVRQYDTLAFAPQSPVRSKLLGMPTEEIDISRLGRYTINGETGELVQSKVLYDTKLTWGTIFLAYRERLGNGRVPQRLESIYWHSTGFWHELLTEFIFELYQDVSYRAITTENLLSIPEHGIGRPPSLLRLDTQTMTIADFFEFPLLAADGQTWDSHMISSPQFIPQTEGSDQQTDGYLFCTVYTLRGSEFWIFDAQDLAQGPLCKLEHPSLKLGSTVHTAWLPKIARRTANYYISAQEDYQSLVAQQPDKIKVLFETEIYPHFPKKKTQTT